MYFGVVFVVVIADVMLFIDVFWGAMTVWLRLMLLSPHPIRKNLKKIFFISKWSEESDLFHLLKED